MKEMQKTQSPPDYRRRFLLLGLGFALVFLGSFLLDRYAVSLETTLRILGARLLEKASFGAYHPAVTWTGLEESVVMNIRLPRILCAALVGAALSTAGASYQGMFRNPMVSPDLMGASTGAGFGASLAILLGLPYFGIMVTAFCFGLLAVLLAYMVSRFSRLNATLALVLAGVMISSLFSGCTSFVKLVADPQEQLPAITYWLMGSLTSVRLHDVAIAALPMALGCATLLAAGSKLERAPRTLVYVGQNTLVYYMLHNFVIKAIEWALKRMDLRLDGVPRALALTLLACLACGAAALAINRFLPELAGRRRQKA